MITAERRAIEFSALERRESRLWSATLALLIVFAVATVAAVRQSATKGSAALAASLMTLACLFALDVAAKRRTLRRSRLELLATRAERRELLRRVGELTDFVGATRVLDAAKSAADLWARVAAETLRLVAADDAWVVLRDSDGCVRLGASTDEPATDELSEGEASAFDQWFDEGALPTLAVGEVAVARNFGAETRFSKLACIVAVPLGPEAAPFGVLVAARRAGDCFDAGALQALGLLADATTRLAALRESERRLLREHRRLSITVQRLSRAQAGLVRGERIRAVGNVVSGVAHELNNPLAAVSGYAQLLACRADAAPERRAEWVAELGRETERCASILRNLLTFARRAADEAPSTAPLATVVRDALELKGYDLRVDCVATAIDVPEDLPTPDLDRAVLQHVLLHLVSNATAALRSVDERRLAIRARVVDEAIELVVSDSGPGVASLLRGRIFDPFFKMKNESERLGLGLSTCRALLERHGGRIELAAEGESSGATFVLTLPLSVAATSEAASR